MSTSQYARDIDSETPLDRWISFAVKVLRDGGIETYESCQGGTGHSYPEPAIRFHGQVAEGFRAITLAANFGLPWDRVGRFWTNEDGVPVGPYWEMTFRPAKLMQRQVEAENDGMLGHIDDDPTPDDHRSTEALPPHDCSVCRKADCREVHPCE